MVMADKRNVQPEGNLTNSKRMFVDFPSCRDVMRATATES